MAKRKIADRPSAAAHQIADECLGMRVRRLSRTVTRLFDDALRPEGISTAQLNMLVAIAHAGPMRPSALARALDLEKSTVTRNLERMLSRGWVRAVRRPEQSGYVVEVQPAGLSLLERAFPLWATAQARARRLVGEALATAVRGQLGAGRAT